MSFKNLIIFCALLFNFLAVNANAASETTVEGSNRMKNRIGAYLGLLGDPFPTIVGVNVAYNVFDFMRVTAGIGQVSESASFGGTDLSAKATTIGAGARFLVPGLNLTPVAGLSFAHVFISNDNGVAISVKNFDESASHLYGNLGVDWQTGKGFNIGGGYNYSFKSGIGGCAYVNLGWFFNFI